MRRPNQRLRDSLSYANVVATLALFVALATGGAYAATQIAKNSVGPSQLRKNAVNSRAVKNGGIAVRDLAKQTRSRLVAVETAKVKSDGSIESGTARDGSRSGVNDYTVVFRRRVGDCTYSATPAAVPFDPVTEPAASARISGQGTGKNGGEVSVTTFDANGSPVASGFHLFVVC